MAFDTSQLPQGFEIPGQTALIAHASIICVVFVLLMTIAAITVRTPFNRIRVARLHAPFQIANVVLALVGIGLGSSVATTRHIPKGSTPHVVLDYVIVGLLVAVQPDLGVLQHLYFRKAERRGIFGWIHLFLGRSILILGLVNGARGFKLARDGKTAPYYAVFGLICAVYICVLLWDWRGRDIGKIGSPQGQICQTQPLRTDIGLTTKELTCILEEDS
ncbi:hypothetical protein LTS13_003142 [Exophiala xenobiotica]|nr:hypothetical protein LTS13_003142 [Exophiala xenobiotica]KAK5396134.1 hypothetical protein LTR79_006888 [Exophiala xenobiotica]KAK5424088.1 hypothetical protein LTR90_001434 [Exophiala xenobiotica]KAK5479891.1 hypothetical protein LTR26_007744 [Exophiala xenobiotica]KAK5490567.1 hypothetical protein LTR83_007003 [Exophiala xenobiotica]